MDCSSLEVSDELAHVVWASNILSFLNPYTLTASDEPFLPSQGINDDDEADFEDGPDEDFTSIDTEQLTANSEILRRKFLDCIGELLAHTKGGKFVTATALREKEDEVEIDIARNNGLKTDDEVCLGFLRRSLAMQADAQEQVTTKAESLLMQFFNFDLRCSALSKAQDRDNQRRKIVELAAATTYPQQAAQAAQGALERMMPSVDPHKVARLLPSFRTVTFISIPPPAPLKLQNHQIPNFQEAWKYLRLPSGPSWHIPPGLARKTHHFRRKCGSNLFTLCEIQLLMRYEAEPSLGPTLAYFRCSKKACFLCESFLALSALKVSTRGRHGECDPQWAVQPCNSESTRQRLNSLCETIKQKIRAKIMPCHTPPPVAIHQSSAVSDLKSLHMLDLMRQSKKREVNDGKAQELRVQWLILSVGTLEIWYRDLRTLCVMCQTPCARRCTQCFAIWYCSNRCQKPDWPAHKLLCSRYRKFLDTRPSKSHRLGIWFPRDANRLRLKWAPIYSPEWGFHYPYFDLYLGSDNGVLFTIPFAENKRRGLELDHYLTIYYRDWNEIANKSVYAAVEACHGTSDHKFADITLADFRHALDWFSTYFNNTVRETPSGGSVLPVKISCPLEQKVHGRELFIPVAIDRDFPSMSSVSPLSQALGLPIRVCQLERGGLERAIGLIDEVSWEECLVNQHA
ncbi:hypothetical protein BDV36DRAFT_293621 [Aspergillus pseudocaelatus]|uniref:MYND-type domain-containing protein n=1 Tax=Aspergillus pseudocaelatus TaxID=1825620 RepID=A0ABQ6WS96_9EURO|nr:hypothetical protein BDV36DRAFT_293621 [Aspergillus pseudocaelatus]